MGSVPDYGPFLWPLFVLLWVALSTYSRVAMRRRRYARARAVPRRAPARPVQPPRGPSPREKWEAACARYGKVAAEYGGYESDALQVLRRPALADPAVPSTARFIDAFHEAMALHTEEFPGDAMAAKFAAAATTAEQAWEAAKEAAEKLRASRFTAEERGLIAQGIKLLELAEGGTTPAEQEAALAAARQVLAKLERSAGTRIDWRVPRTAHAALERNDPRQLPPG